MKLEITLIVVGLLLLPFIFIYPKTTWVIGPIANLFVMVAILLQRIRHRKPRP